MIAAVRAPTLLSSFLRLRLRLVETITHSFTKQTSASLAVCLVETPSISLNVVDEESQTRRAEEVSSCDHRDMGVIESDGVVGGVCIESDELFEVSLK